MTPARLNAEAVARGLKGARRTGRGWTACCPVHEDTNPSLSINEGPGGRVLVHCHTGCSQRSVIDALKERGLWNTAENGQWNTTEASYEYCDADGRLIYMVHRFPSKRFRQQRADGQWTMEGVERVPYRLPDWIEGQRVLVVEGEKDVETLRTFGLHATCNSGGAGKWSADIAPYFRDMSVTILPDNDEVGRSHARSVAASLEGIASEVWILELPNLPAKGDVSDWLARDGTPKRLRELLSTAVPAAEWASSNGNDQPPVSQGRGQRFMLADNQLADLILETDERGRWLYDHKRGLYRAPATSWDWRLDPEGRRLGDRLRMLAKGQARKTEKVLALRRSTVVGAREMVKDAVSHTPDWDADPMLAGLPGGGVLDLTTGDARSARRTDFVSRWLGVRPDPEVKAERFLRFLSEMTGGDVEVLAWLRVWAGYILTGLTVKHVAVFLYGSGEAGKSTLVELLTYLLGDYVTRVPPDALVAKRGTADRHPEWMTGLDGARFASAAEMPTRGRLRAGLFKTLTGGDTIRANRMRMDGYSFRPSAKLIMYGNNRPTIPGWDSGLKRRLAVVLCAKAANPDEALPDQLRAEAPGILHWIVEAAAEGWQRHQSGEGWFPDELPPAIQSETAEWFQENDPLGEAFEAILEFTGQHRNKATAKAIRDAVEGYFRRNGLGNAPSAKALASALKSHGAIKTRTGGARAWQGLRLLV